MDRLKKFEKSNIEKVLRDNFSRLMPTFYEMESSFLSGVYKRYGDLEGGNIVIYFARDLHLEILRKRENDLSFDLSLDMFWQNHKNIRQGKKKIIVVSKETGLPKETARRKIISLIKKKHLRKEEKNRLFWEPASEHKETYLKIIGEQINSLSKFILEQTKLLQLNVPLVKIEREIKKNYSFYWYHYLTVQLQYIKFWQEKLNDLEMLLIGLQTTIQTVNHLNRKTENGYLITLKSQKNFDLKEANISATSVSEVTGIPRATCIRKLDKFVKMKVLEKDSESKRYFLKLNQTTLNPMLDTEWLKQKISILSEFSSVIMRGLFR
jgi:Fic family protein